MGDAVGMVALGLFVVVVCAGWVFAVRCAIIATRRVLTDRERVPCDDIRQAVKLEQTREGIFS